MVSRLRLSDVRIERAGRTVIGGLSLTVEAGTALMLTGPNGAGKTTLLRAVAGLLPVAAGAIAFDDADPDREMAEHSHFLALSDAAKASLTVAENAGFWSDYLGTGADPLPALDRLGLAGLAAVPAGWLSSGQRRRLSLARLLLVERPVWLLDEPTVALDSNAMALLDSLVAEHVARGGLAVVATHAPLAIASARRLHLEPASGFLAAGPAP